MMVAKQHKGVLESLETFIKTKGFSSAALRLSVVIKHLP